MEQKPGTLTIGRWDVLDVYYNVADDIQATIAYYEKQGWTFQTDDNTAHHPRDGVSCLQFFKHYQRKSKKIIK